MGQKTLSLANDGSSPYVRKQTYTSLKLSNEIGGFLNILSDIAF